MKAKVYVQHSTAGSNWLTLEIQDANGNWLYRSKRLGNSSYMFTQKHSFDFKDQMVDYTQGWRDDHKERLSEFRRERTCKEPKVACEAV